MDSFYLYKIIINGGHVIGISFLISFIDPLFAFYIYLKLQSVVYYNTFSELYPKFFRWKHMARLTDTGFFANMLFYYYPQYLPVCYNVQFIITFGYWVSIFCFGMKDRDDVREEPLIMPFLHDTHSNLNHSIPWIILSVYQYYNNYVFDENSLYFSFVWVYLWLLFIYIPWRTVTNDIVYSVLDFKRSKITTISIFIVMHGLLFLSNESGKLLGYLGNY